MVEEKKSTPAKKKAAKRKTAKKVAKKKAVKKPKPARTKKKAVAARMPTSKPGKKRKRASVTTFVNHGGENHGEDQLAYKATVDVLQSRLGELDSNHQRVLVAARAALRAFPYLISFGQFDLNQDSMPERVSAVLSAGLVTCLFAATRDREFSEKVVSKDELEGFARRASYTFIDAQDDNSGETALAAVNAAYSAAETIFAASESTTSAATAAARAAYASRNEEERTAAVQVTLAEVERIREEPNCATYPLFFLVSSGSPRVSDHLQRVDNAAKGNLDLEQLAERYRILSEKGFDFNLIQLWLFNEIRVDLSSWLPRATDPSELFNLPHTGGRTEPNRIEESAMLLLRDSEWTSLFFFHSALKAREHLRLLDAPTVDAVRSLLQSDGGQTMDGEQLTEKSWELLSEFGNATIPPIWQTWFRSVKHPELVKELERSMAHE